MRTPPNAGSPTQLHASSHPHAQPQPCTLTLPYMRRPVQHPLGAGRTPGSQGSLALSILPSDSRRGQGCGDRDRPGKRIFQPYNPGCQQHGRMVPSLPILGPCHGSLGTRRHAEDKPSMLSFLAVPTQGELRSRIWPRRTSSPGILCTEEGAGVQSWEGFLTAAAGAGNAAPHPLVRGASLGVRRELGDRGADGWRQESRAWGLDGVKIWGAESKLPRAGVGRHSSGPVGMPVLLGRGVGRAPGSRRLPVVRVVVNPRHMVVAGEVRVLGRPRHVILGVEVEAGMPDRAGIHVGVLIQKITYIHLPRPAPRTCCSAVPPAAGRVWFGGEAAAPPSPLLTWAPWGAVSRGQAPPCPQAFIGPNLSQHLH